MSRDQKSLSRHSSGKHFYPTSEISGVIRNQCPKIHHMNSVSLYYPRSFQKCFLIWASGLLLQVITLTYIDLYALYVNVYLEDAYNLITFNP